MRVDLLRPLRAFDRVQPDRPALAVPAAVIKKFSDDQASNLAALIAYYAFLSLFPLLLVFVTVLAYVLHGDPSAERAVSQSVLGRFPVIGADLRTRQLHGHVLAVAIGVVGLLWAGLGVTQAAENAFNKVWAIPYADRPNFLRARLRGLAVVGTIGILFVVSSALAGLVAGGLGGVAAQAAGVVLSLALNMVMFGAAFRLLTASSVPTRCLWVGVVIGGSVWEVVQLLGGYYVDHVVAKATGTYGVFALVIGLLAWLHLGAQTTLYAAEANAVLARRLWPRSLLAVVRPADERARTALAQIEQRSPDQEITVRFRHPSS